MSSQVEIKGSRSWFNRKNGLGVESAQDDYSGGVWGAIVSHYSCDGRRFEERYICHSKYIPFDAAILYHVLFVGPVLSRFPNPCSTCTCHC